MLNRSQINIAIANAVLFLLVFAIAGDLSVEAWPRKMFYAGCYLSGAGLLLFSNWQTFKCWLESQLVPVIFIISLFLLGLSKMLWSAYFPAGHFSDIQNNYHVGGKMLMLSSVVAFYLFRMRDAITPWVYRAALALSLLLGLFTVWVGYQEQASGILRIKLYADAATTAGYIIVLHALLTMALIQRVITRGKPKALALGFSFCLFMFLLVMTGTRGAIGTFFIMSFVMMCFELRRVKAHHWVAAAVVLGIIGAGVTWEMKARVFDAMNDLQLLQENNANTSIGARVVMLRAAAHVAHFTLLGQSVTERYDSAVRYIKEQKINSPEAIRAMGYHFHNEVMESLSLQGVFGFLALLLFYLSALRCSLRPHHVVNTGLLTLVGALMLMGLTDVILIQNNTAMVVGACSAIVLMASGRKTAVG